MRRMTLSVKQVTLRMETSVWNSYMFMRSRYHYRTTTTWGSQVLCLLSIQTSKLEMSISLTFETPQYTCILQPYLDENQPRLLHPKCQSTAGKPCSSNGTDGRSYSEDAASFRLPPRPLATESGVIVNRPPPDAPWPVPRYTQILQHKLMTIVQNGISYAHEDGR